MKIDGEREITRPKIKSSVDIKFCLPNQAGGKFSESVIEVESFVQQHRGKLLNRVFTKLWGIFHFRNNDIRLKKYQKISMPAADVVHYSSDIKICKVIFSIANLVRAERM
ncbi:hypothetical protein CDAR_15021 [Caerostris darwini]|uniref:Uncharacterized protein n=1 Tax=Caerostris darwini TaxID=1538125 RepID=A0AAV4PBU5_9ARAC|nr:hypothetical protein CDAR_15021 [Caerostris darwini]